VRGETASDPGHAWGAEQREGRILKRLLTKRPEFLESAGDRKTQCLQTGP